jgi:hypothetical protein
MPSLRKGVYDKMNRLKFRQYHNGKFHYWGYVDEDDTFISPIHGESQQFTGLLDKLGKEIYEGDIVRKYGEGKHEVYWHEFTACWRMIGFTGMTKGDSALSLEVIGNIWENGDLLK